MSFLKLGKPPALCFYCDPDAPCELLHLQAPTPCELCRAEMKESIVFISKTNDGGPVRARTGSRVCMSAEWVRENINPPQVADSVIKRRIAFVEENAWTLLKLKRTKSVLYDTVVEYLDENKRIVSVDHVYCHAKDDVEAKIKTIQGEPKGTRFRIVGSAPVIGVFGDTQGNHLVV